MILCPIPRCDRSHYYNAPMSTYAIRDASVKPYATVAKKAVRLSSDEMPCSLPNRLFSACISWECGAAS